MDGHARLQADLMLGLAAERLAETAVHRCGGVEAAVARVRDDPQGEGVWLDRFVDTLFEELLLDDPAGACFVLEALERRPARIAAEGTVGEVLRALAHRTFADVLRARVLQGLEQSLAVGA